MISTYVFPNVSDIRQRGGLSERWELAERFDCAYIEVPADFIKNKTEVDKTDLVLCDFLTEKSIPLLYERGESVPAEAKYIIHTEPSLLRDDGYGLRRQAALRWNEMRWVEAFVRMILSISRYFEKAASVIEIHPGDRRNSFNDIGSSIEFLLDSYKKSFDFEPLILLENRTDQFISNGAKIREYWAFLIEKFPHLEAKTAIVLDIQQLYTATKESFLDEYYKIPTGAINGLHIHHLHRAPSLSDPIPWKEVFKKAIILDGQVLVNPEIHHKNKVQDAIKFCQQMIHDARAEEIADGYR